MCFWTKLCVCVLYVRCSLMECKRQHNIILKYILHHKKVPGRHDYQFVFSQFFPQFCSFKSDVSVWRNKMMKLPRWYQSFIWKHTKYFSPVCSKYIYDSKLMLMKLWSEKITYDPKNFEFSKENFEFSKNKVFLGFFNFFWFFKFSLIFKFFY